MMKIIEVMNKPCSGCANYDGKRSLKIDTNKKNGLAQQLELLCSCGNNTKFYSSKRIEPDKSKPIGSGYYFGVNVRAVICFRELGLGHFALENFSRHMNMPPPLRKHSYENIMNLTRDDDQPCDIVASFDGSWQRRGYASLNGIVSCIERTNEKVVDIEVKTKKCMSCTFWDKKKDSPHYQAWKDNHVCYISHKGSASSLETSGTVAIFKRSVEKRNLQYTTFIGDGDSSSYPTVVGADPYHGKEIKKGECIGHVQKRVGTNLRNIRKNMSKERKKKVFGRGKLNDAAINYIQNCYGLAIRQNTHCLYQRKKNVSATLTHCSDIKPESERHKWCNRTPDSWCSFQKLRTCLNVYEMIPCLKSACTAKPKM